MNVDHDVAIEAACDLDRRYFEEHPEAVEYLRRPVEHEVCIPGHPCWSLAGYLVMVRQFAPGVRARMIVPAGALPDHPQPMAPARLPLVPQPAERRVGENAPRPGERRAGGHATPRLTPVSVPSPACRGQRHRYRTDRRRPP